MEIKQDIANASKISNKIFANHQNVKTTEPNALPKVEHVKEHFKEDDKNQVHEFREERP